MIKRGGAVSIATLACLLAVLPGNSLAQGLNLSQLLGGSSTHHRSSSGQSNEGGVTVQRSASPFTGKFVGEQEDQGADTKMTAQFACYPATDSALPQAKAFMCYTAASKPSGSNGGADKP
jgi:hypothetical protein